MNVFLSIITSYPVVIYTFILIFVIFYWFIAILGMIDIDVLDFSDLETSSDLESLNGLAGLLTKFGLAGVPITVIVSFIALFGWIISYLAVWALPFIISGLWVLITGTAVLVVSALVAVVLTRIAVKPLKPLFVKNTARTNDSLLGQAVEIRSSWVNDSFGQAEFKDVGTSMIINVRAKTPNQLKKGDRVILLEYFAEENAYLVIPEREFY